MTRSTDRTGILIARLWVEHDLPHGFRAHITQTMDASEPKAVSAVAASPDDVYAAVRTWVEAFLVSS